LLCAFEKSEKKGKVITNIFSTMYFVKIDQLQYPGMTTALQTCYDINANSGHENKDLLSEEINSFRLLKLWEAVHLPALEAVPVIQKGK
jgi:hypothetical protein